VRYTKEEKDKALDSLTGKVEAWWKALSKDDQILEIIKAYLRRNS